MMIEIEYDDVRRKENRCLQTVILFPCRPATTPSYLTSLDSVTLCLSGNEEETFHPSLRCIPGPTAVPFFSLFSPLLIS